MSNQTPEIGALRQKVIERLDDLHVHGWIVVPDRQTGDPIQEEVTLDYIADAVLDVAFPPGENGGSA